ncbi:hypothetical protein EV360DRAFT_76969 [Lentinula raphanica]|nr:hypothetical protein EV360DRAFT_76969 [Lentinula raphanica]
MCTSPVTDLMLSSTIELQSPLKECMNPPKWTAVNEAQPAKKQDGPIPSQYNGPLPPAAFPPGFLLPGGRKYEFKPGSRRQQREKSGDPSFSKWTQHYAMIHRVNGPIVRILRANNNQHYYLEDEKLLNGYAILCLKGAQQTVDDQVKWTEKALEETPNHFEDPSIYQEILIRIKTKNLKANDIIDIGLASHDNGYENLSYNVFYLHSAGMKNVTTQASSRVSGWTYSKEEFVGNLNVWHLNTVTLEC